MTSTSSAFPGRIRQLMVVICTVLFGVKGMVSGAFPQLPVIPGLQLSPGSGAVLTLSGLALLGVMTCRRRAVVLVSVLLIVVAMTALVQVVLSRASAGNVSAAEILLALLLSIACLFNHKTRVRHTLWSTFAISAVVVGALSLGAKAVGFSGVSIGDRAVLPSLMTDIIVILLGAVAYDLARNKTRSGLALPGALVRTAIVSLTLAFLLALSGALLQQYERHQTAAYQLDHLASSLQSALKQQAATVERIAERWKLLGGLPESSVLDLESHALFRDQAHVEGLAYVNQKQGVFWRNARDGRALLWLDEQLLAPDTRNWIAHNQEDRGPGQWRFAKGPASGSAMLWVAMPGDGPAYLLATVDVAGLFQEQVRKDLRGFSVRIGVDDGPLVYPGPENRSGVNGSGAPIPLYASMKTEMPGVGLLRLAAYGTSMDFGVLHGLMPAGTFFLALLLVYHLLNSRALLWLQRLKDEQLHASEHRFRSLFANNPSLMFTCDRQGRFVNVNPEMELALGTVETELRGHHFSRILPNDDVVLEGVSSIDAVFHQALAGQSVSFKAVLGGGRSERRVYEVTVVPTLTGGQVEGLLGVAQDTTARVSAEESEKVLRRCLEASGNAVMVCEFRNESFPVVYVNPAFARISGYSAAEVTGQELNLLTGRETADEDIRSIRAAIAERRPLSVTVRSYRRNGEQFWNQLFLSPVLDDGNDLTHYIAIMNDISQQRERDEQLAFRATHDVLTGLGNRSLFDDHLAHDVELARRNGRSLAVLFIDLDEFKPINDTLGHKVGDAVLVSVTRRLSANLRPSDTLCRFGGDEFVLLLPDLSSSKEAEEVAERLLDELAHAHRIEGHELHVSASIGISTLNDQIADPEKLIQHADMAMYKAKQKGRNTYEVYSGDLDSKLNARVSLRNELQEAISGNQLVLHYQPLLDASGRVDGIEALVRWQHPEKGFISPGDFIPLAEQTGQIAPLSRWILDRACRDALLLTEKGLLSGRVAVNLSPLQFHRPNFLAGLRKTLEKTGLPATMLELELTEGILMQDTDGTIDILNALNGMGVSTAIDDFGTGFSSLSYLRTLPIDKVKIDRTFVTHVHENDKDAAVCKGVITLARELELKVVAEGIESEKQYSYLRACGCDVFQGFLLAHPMPIDALAHWLSSKQRSSTEVQRVENRV